MTFPYQICLLGDFKPHQRTLKTHLLKQTAELGIADAQISFVDESNIGKVNPKGPLVAIFFGYDGADNASHPALSSLIKDSTTIIPCVGDLTNVGLKLPPIISHINAFALKNGTATVERLVTLVLENLRLLRSERRLFISYKRSEAQSIAAQLYESLDEAGFDVFLDTRSVPYGVDFQSILWHRMADSDVVILLDTPNFRDSYWTQQELSQANATNIQILHLLWPNVKADESSAFSEFLKLKASSFKSRSKKGERALFANSTVMTVVAKAESLRARALAARHRSLIDNFCDQARDQKARKIAVQPERYISLELAKGDNIAVVPTVGVPRADRYQEIEKAIGRTGKPADQFWLLYDERGILTDWLEHLEWLDGHLPVKSVQVSKCASKLQGRTK